MAFVEFIEHLQKLLVGLVSEKFATAVVLLLFVVLVLFGRWLWRLGERLWCFVASRRRTLKAYERKMTRDGPREGDGVWLTKPVYPPNNYEA
jgi:hypothetical protein